MVDWKPFVDLVRRHRRFLLTTHVRPDGDGLGSMLALADALEKQGNVTSLNIASAFPQRYRFLDPESRIKQFDHTVAAPADVIIVLDTGTWNQLGDIGPYIRKQSVPKIVIDHHVTQDDLGAMQLVDVGAEATGRLAYEAIHALGAPLTARMAEMLLVAVAMDTGWFRHSNTRSETFELAAELVNAGAKPESLYQALFEQNTLARLKLSGVVLERLQTAENGRLAYSEIRLADYQATEATPQDSEDLINFIRSIEGVEVGLLFMEQPRGGVKVSFRSRRVDVAKVAETFGGGGHRLASGATVDAAIDAAKLRVLQAVAAAIQAAK